MAASREALGALLDAASEPLLLIDGRGAFVHCNRAALRTLGCEPGGALGALEASLGATAVAWMHQVRGDGRAGPETTRVRLEDGRTAQLALRRIEPALWTLGVTLEAAAAPAAAAAAELAHIASPAVRDMVRLLWDSPFPASLQDSEFRFVSVNAAYADFTGRSRESLLGTDPLELQPEEDRMFNLASRERLRERPDDPEVPRLIERRLLDAGGRERWFRLSRRVLQGADGRPLYLSVLQDCTAEHVAREQADRTLRELDEWFDLSPVGMVLYDDTGLLVRSNPAFEAMAGQVPVTLGDAAPALQSLLAWGNGAPAAELQPGAPALECRATLALPDGRRPVLSARVRAFLHAGAQRRFLAVVEDRRVEQERDLAQLEIGALVDTAGIGVATFEESRGWLPSSVRQVAGAGRAGAAAGLQSISRDIVEPESMAEYERLQRALKRGERAEVRYAVRHPELGARWLLTRVEPGRLASGGRTTSVVTLDVTEQEQAQRRSAQLLRELSTILDGTSAGIAYLRGDTLVRCNQAFERMLGATGGQVAGASLSELFADAAMLRRRLEQLGDDESHDSEFQGGPQGAWYSLSVRRAAGSGEALEAVAVLTDITRRKAQQLELEAAREQLQHQAERTRAVLDSVLVGIVTVRDGGIEWMNRSARRMFAGELAEFIGQPIATVATPDPDHPLRRTDLHRLAEGQAEAFECRLKARDGREFWVVGNAVVTGREGGGSQLTIALLDIERRRQAEVRIAQAQASLARIIETAPLAIALLDARTHRVQQLNHIAADFAHRSIDDALGLAPDELFEPEFARELTADLRHALDTRDLVRRELKRSAPGGETRTWDARYVPLAAPGDAPDQVLVVASDVSEQRAADEARLAAAIAQREMLVKEVHHRIKNNLQGVAGLMQQIAQRRPEVAPVISEAIGQVQAIAQVYGLQVGAVGPLRVKSLVEAIGSSVQRMFGRPITVTVRGESPQRWALPEAESIPIALTVNELLTNALKHGGGDGVNGGEPVRCTLDCGDAEVTIEIANTGALPEGFDLHSVPGGVSGLGLVRALLPRRSATLTLAQRGADVVAAIALKPPGVRELEPL